MSTLLEVTWQNVDMVVHDCIAVHSYEDHNAEEDDIFSDCLLLEAQYLLIMHMKPMSRQFGQTLEHYHYPQIDGPQQRVEPRHGDKI